MKHFDPIEDRELIRRNGDPAQISSVDRARGHHQQVSGQTKDQLPTKRSKYAAFFSESVSGVRFPIDVSTRLARSSGPFIRESVV
jgi:hypothetical protein